MNGWAKAVLIVLAVVGTVVVLFTWVFPWVETTLLTDPTLGLLGAPQ